MPVVTNTLLDPEGNPLRGVQVSIRLVAGARPDQPGWSSIGEVTSSVWATTDTTGTWAATLTSNATIQPANSYYAVTERPDDGPARYAIVVPNGAGPYRVGAILTTPPPTPAALAVSVTQLAVPNGVATLGPDGRLVASQAPTGGGGSASSLPLFNVLDYGAVGDGIADDFPAFVAAFTALFASNAPGLVYAPYTVANIYRLAMAGHVGTGTGHTWNAAIKIPYRDSLNTPMVTWGIIGPADAVALVGRKWPGDGQQTRQGQGGAPIILIDYDTPYAWDNALGHPSWIGAPHDAPTNVHWYSRGLTFRQPDNPSLAALDLYGLEACTVDEIYFDTTAYPDATSEPTHPTGTGIIWPHNANSAVLTAGRIGIWGHFAGIGPAEHLDAQYVYAVRCRLAHPVREGIGHAGRWGTTVSEECTFVIAGYDPSDSIGIVPVPDNCKWTIAALDIEDFQPDGASWAYGPDHGSHVYDGNNALKGVCWYNRHNSGPTGSRGDTSELTGKGGTGMAWYSLIDAGTAHTVTQTGHDPEPPGATVPGAPTIGTATAGSASATVAFTPPASDGGSAITSYVATSTPDGITGTAASSPITITGLTIGTTYTFTVHAVNALGPGPESAASNSVTPTAFAGAQVYFGPDWTPLLDDVVEGGGLGAVGTIIQTSVAGNLSHIGWRSPNTAAPPTQDIQYGIWVYQPGSPTVPGMLLAGSLFAAAGTLPPNQWVEVELGNLVHLNPGDIFVAAVGPVFEYAATPHYFDTAVTQGALTGIANDNGVFVVGTTFTFPTAPFNATAYGVGVRFIPD